MLIYSLSSLRVILSLSSLQFSDVERKIMEKNYRESTLLSGRLGIPWGMDGDHKGRESIVDWRRRCKNSFCFVEKESRQMDPRELSSKYIVYHRKLSVRTMII